MSIEEKTRLANYFKKHLISVDESILIMEGLLETIYRVKEREQ